MDKTDQAIVLLDDGLVVESNRQACTLFACEKKDFIGSSIVDFMPDCQLDGTLSREQFPELIAFYTGKEPYAFEWLFSKRDQTPVIATITVAR